jgi:hypothetical protein
MVRVPKRKLTDRSAGPLFRESDVPKRLTISDDLQIISSEGYGFLSKSRKDLEAVEREVEAWIDANPSHARVDEAKRWLTEAAEKIFEIQLRRRMETKRMEVAAMEKLVRREVQDYLWLKKVRFSDLPHKTDELTKKIMAEIYESE